MSTSYDFKCVTCNVTEDIESNSPKHLEHAYLNSERLIAAQEILDDLGYDTEGITEHGGLYRNTHAAMRFLQRHRGHILVIVSEYGEIFPIRGSPHPLDPAGCAHDWRYDSRYGAVRECRICSTVQRLVWQDLPAKEEDYA